MESLASPLSPGGRIAPKPFWIGAAVVYLVSFLTQFLLAAPVIARASVIPFVAAQAAIAWIWYDLHARRLRDAGRETGVSVAFCVLYLLAMALLVLVVVGVSASGSSLALASADQPPPGGVFDVLLIAFLLGVVFGQPGLGIFAYVLAGVLALVLAPIVIAIAFTIWAGLQPRVPAQP
jgi:uncharacterized membrane protein YhaH (DUF805 family)